MKNTSSTTESLARYPESGGLYQTLGNTRCPNCRALPVERVGYRIHGFGPAWEGQSPSSRTATSGIWEHQE